MLILQEGQLSPSQSKSHISYCFNVESEIQRLNISFSYSPKYLTDAVKARELLEYCFDLYIEKDSQVLLDNLETFMPLNNLITLSVDDPNRYRGAVHRHSPEQHLFITEHEASPGLLPGKLIRGEWKVVISIHAVLTETCNYKLQVWGEGGIEE